MNLQEIRIGNLVSLKTHSGLNAIVTEIGTHNDHPYVRCKDVHAGCYLYDFKEREIVNPIPINEPWLIRFGFRKEFCDDKSYYYALNFKKEKYCNLCFMSSDFKTVTLFPFDDFFEYKYVHQLQNLYLDITGVELSINNYEPTI